MTATFITPAVVARFIEYAKDAGNWGGTPCVGGNVGGDAADKGYLANMKKAGLIQTFESDGATFVEFLPAGAALAAEHGINLKAEGR